MSPSSTPPSTARRIARRLGAGVLAAALLPAAAAAAPSDPDMGFSGDGLLEVAGRGTGTLLTLPDDRLLWATYPATDPTTPEVRRRRFRSGRARRRDVPLNSPKPCQIFAKNWNVAFSILRPHRNG